MADSAMDDKAAVLEKIAGMTPFQDIAARIHEIILETAPELEPRLWYGMPGYAKAKRSPVICFISVDDYVTFGLTEKANLTRAEGAPDLLIESAWFLTELDEPTEKRIAEIVKNATG